MFRVIFFSQAFIYLLLMPVLHGSAEIGYRPSVGTGLLAIASLFIGAALNGFRENAAGVVRSSLPPVKLEVRPVLVYTLPFFVALYAAMVMLFGLFNRRQGSEYMAQLYADLPIYALGIVRVYEIFLIPFALLCIFGAFASVWQRRIMIFSILVSLPFTGLESSRGRLLLIAIYLMCFVRVGTFVTLFFKYIRFYLAAIPVVGIFVFYSLERSKSYGSFGEYLLAEIYRRLDGLNLVTDLRDAGLIDKFGQFDFAMFGPLISKIPFLEAARAAKAMGRTSTKQYYLQELLGRSQLDTSNSMIADPLYFAGWIGVAIIFGAIGFFIARSDAFVARGYFMARRQQTALAMAFVTSFAIIEIDFVAAVLTFIQNYIFISLLMAAGAARSNVQFSSQEISSREMQRVATG